MSSKVNSILARRAIARRWMIAFVEPPRAPSTVAAFTNEDLLRILSGVKPIFTASTIARPVLTPAISRSPVGAAAVELPAIANPRASEMQAIVDAVPITVQVPPLGAKTPETSFI